MFVNQKCENDFVEPKLGNKKCFYKVGSIRILNMSVFII